MRADPCDATRYEALWRAHADDLVRYATLLIGPDDAADVVADAFSRVVVRDLDDISNHRAYLYRAVTNKATDWKRSLLRRRVRDLHGVVASVFDSNEPETDLLRAIAALSAQQRAVVYFTYWEDLGAPAVGEVLGIAPATVRRHLARARHRLRKVL